MSSYLRTRSIKDKTLSPNINMFIQNLINFVNISLQKCYVIDYEIVI